MTFSAPRKAPRSSEKRAFSAAFLGAGLLFFLWDFFAKKSLVAQKKVLPLQRNSELSCGVMVAHRILVPLVRVRILPGQQERRSDHGNEVTSHLLQTI